MCCSPAEALKEELSDSQAQVSQINQEKAELEAEMSRLQAAHGDLEARIAQLEQTIEQVRRVINSSLWDQDDGFPADDNFMDIVFRKRSYSSQTIFEIPIKSRFNRFYW